MTMRALLFALVLAGSAAQARPVSFTLQNGLIPVPVTVGEHELPLMLDLGDFRAISLTSAVLDSVGVRFTGAVDHFSNFAGDTFEARRFVADDVALGALRHAELEGSEDVHDPSNPSPNAYGAIGRAFFDGHRLSIDYEASTLAFDAPLPENTLRIPLHDRDGMLLVDVTVDGHDFTFLLDTGAMVSVIDASLLPETGRFQEQHSVHTAGTLAVGDVEHEGVELFRIDLGGGFDGILGSDVLRHQRVHVDLEGGWLALTAP